MIYARYNRQRYGIQFSYTKDGRGHRKNTGCTIFVLGARLEPNDMPELINLGSGFADLHRADNFCAEVGRKIALERAIDNVAFYEPLLNCKQFRSAIWKAYHERRNALADAAEDKPPPQSSNSQYLMNDSKFKY